MKESIHKRPNEQRMKRPALSLVFFAVLGAMSFPTGNAQAAAEGKPKVIGYYMDASDDYYKAGFQVFKAPSG